MPYLLTEVMLSQAIYDARLICEGDELDTSELDELRKLMGMNRGTLEMHAAAEAEATTKAQTKKAFGDIVVKRGRLLRRLFSQQADLTLRGPAITMYVTGTGELERSRITEKEMRELVNLAHMTPADVEVYAKSIVGDNQTAIDRFSVSLAKRVNSLKALLNNKQRDDLSRSLVADAGKLPAGMTDRIAKLDAFLKLPKEDVEALLKERHGKVTPEMVSDYVREAKLRRKDLSREAEKLPGKTLKATISDKHKTRIEAFIKRFFEEEAPELKGVIRKEAEKEIWEIATRLKGLSSSDAMPLLDVKKEVYRLRIEGQYPFSIVGPVAIKSIPTGVETRVETGIRKFSRAQIETIRKVMARKSGYFKKDKDGEYIRDEDENRIPDVDKIPMSSVPKSHKYMATSGQMMLTRPTLEDPRGKLVSEPTTRRLDITSVEDIRKLLDIVKDMVSGKEPSASQEPSTEIVSKREVGKQELEKHQKPVGQDIQGQIDDALGIDPFKTLVSLRSQKDLMAILDRVASDIDYDIAIAAARGRLPNKIAVTLAGMWPVSRGSSWDYEKGSGDTPATIPSPYNTIGSQIASRIMSKISHKLNKTTIEDEVKSMIRDAASMHPEIGSIRRNDDDIIKTQIRSISGVEVTVPIFKGMSQLAYDLIEIGVALDVLIRVQGKLRAALEKVGHPRSISTVDNAIAEWMKLYNKTREMYRAVLKKHVEAYMDKTLAKRIVSGREKIYKGGISLTTTDVPVPKKIRVSAVKEPKLVERPGFDVRKAWKTAADKRRRLTRIAKLKKSGNR